MHEGLGPAKSSLSIVGGKLQNLVAFCEYLSPVAQLFMACGLIQQASCLKVLRYLCLGLRREGLHDIEWLKCNLVSAKGPSVFSSFEKCIADLFDLLAKDLLGGCAHPNGTGRLLEGVQFHLVLNRLSGFNLVRETFIPIAMRRRDHSQRLLAFEHLFQCPLQPFCDRVGAERANHDVSRLHGFEFSFLPGSGTYNCCLIRNRASTCLARSVPLVRNLIEQFNNDPAVICNVNNIVKIDQFDFVLKC
mmetsp:Transcript_24554/g.65536  ORF Transcript_24554/g.65536 Transcript_24554/m.65536 type:complete len:247 (+) Transcript_24554:357-1097(+)